MQLKDFLLTADSDHVIALQQARDYAETHPVFITSNSLTVYVVGAGLYDVFTDIANDTASPVRGICMALMDRLRGQSEFNLSESLPLGQANIAMLNALIAALPQHEPAISNLKATLLAVSNKPVKPFEGITLHDVLLARDACPTSQVTTLNSGYAIITVNSDCEMHNPRLIGEHNILGMVQINQFKNVSKAGQYHARVPTEYLSINLYVDNAYGAI